MHTCNSIHYIPDNTSRGLTLLLSFYDINGQYELDDVVKQSELTNTVIYRDEEHHKNIRYTTRHLKFGL